MPMMNGQGRRIPDFDPSVLLRDPAAANITATTAGTALTLNRLTQAYWDNSELPLGSFGVAFHVHTIDRTTGDETYTFEVQVASDSAFTTPVTVATLPGVVSRGYFELHLDGETLQDYTTGAWIRVRAVLGGTTPILGYGAWLFHADRNS